MIPEHLKSLFAVWGLLHFVPGIIIGMATMFTMPDSMSKWTRLRFIWTALFLLTFPLYAVMLLVLYAVLSVVFTIYNFYECSALHRWLNAKPFDKSN